MDDVSIHPAQAHDTEPVLELIEALLAELGQEGQEFAQIDRVRLRRELGREMGSSRFLALLARDVTGAAVGVLTLSATFAIYAGGEYGVIDEMYVKPEWRGRGIGRRLVQSAVGIAQERRWFRLDVTGPNGACDETEGETVPALRFYRRLGFEPTGQKLRLLVERPADGD